MAAFRSATSSFFRTLACRMDKPQKKKKERERPFTGRGWGAVVMRVSYSRRDLEGGSDGNETNNGRNLPSPKPASYE